ncbi:MAG: DUF192 domain-containing protein [Opitutales bacterium]|nr:DUF192 domain-containing protein [Opitutales bacterium]
MQRLLPLLFLLFLTACNTDNNTVSVATEPKPLEHPFSLRIGDHTAYAEIAVSEREQRRGLMYRERLRTDHGMLFPYQQPRQMRFWMANTMIHLDIGFFDSEGVLREIHQMVAGDTQTTVSRRDDLQFALEMDQGWFRDKGIRPGTQMNLDDLRRALAGRGADPRRYGL